MSISPNLRKFLHRKSAEYCSPLTAGNTIAGGFVTNSNTGLIPDSPTTFYVGGVSAIWNYHVAQDAWLQLPNSGIAGTFGAGSCGEAMAISAPGGNTTNTATGGDSVDIFTTLTLAKNLSGCFIRVVAGGGVGYYGKISYNSLGPNATIRVALQTAVVGVTPFSATTQFQLFAGSLWFFNAGAGAVGFSVYDVATNAWTARSVSGLPTTWATEGQLVSTQSSNYPKTQGYQGYSGFTFGYVESATNTVITCPSYYGTGFAENGVNQLTIALVSGTGAGQSRRILASTTTQIVTEIWDVIPDSTTRFAILGGVVQEQATSATATTLVLAEDQALTNQYRNYQVRIIAGTGIGQIRTIVSNTATTLTVSAWTVTPDSTSVYRIEGNDDYLYLLGNAAVATYRYSISANTWSTLAPTAARAAAPAGGMTADWINGVSGASYSRWRNVSPPEPLYSTTLYKQDGRYIFSFRGGASSLLDVYDIPGNTWVSAVPYSNQMETFTTGSCAVHNDGIIYLQKEATGRILRLDVETFCLTPFTFNPVPQGAVLAGDKMFVASYAEAQSELSYLYSLGHTRPELTRWMVVEPPRSFLLAGS